jgi:hypothetical protein
MATQETSRNKSSNERETAIRLLLSPQSYIIPTTSDENAELRTAIRDKPEKLEALGLSRVQVFSPTCTDPHRGTWMVGRFQIWVDKETGAPIDSPTVKILDRLPESIRTIALIDLINFLRPTYCRSSDDAQTLVDLFHAAGPSSTWGLRT